MAYQIPEEVIEEVRKSNDIVDVIGEYVQLKKQGRNYFGLCPFHGEKTPSFSVTQDKQIFHCFGCNKGGNVVTFMMEIESFSFVEAIRFLANRRGIPLPEIDINANNTSSKQELDILAAYEWLTKLYHHLIRFTKDGKEGYQYLRDRGISDEAIDTFQLGFAPNVRDFTVQFLKKKGFNEALLVNAGLVSLQNDNSVIDRFRGRVIFPIRNHIGKPIAFGGRSIAGGEPKYLNSAESELFQKGKLLYNFDLAKKHIRKQNEVVLFEGYMDVISSYQAGVLNGVATLGTSLTESQAKLLKRYVDTVIVCYDGDRAGVEATYKAANILRKAGCQVKVANLENGLDPDTYIQTYGGEAFKNEVIKASNTYLSFYMRYMRKDFNLSLESDRLAYLDIILNELAKLESVVEREYYVREISKEHNLSVESLSSEIESIRDKQGYSKDKSEEKRYTNRAIRKPTNNKLLPAYHNAERKLLSYMLQDVYIAEKVQQELGAGFNVDAHKIIATYLFAFYEEGNKSDVSLFVEKLEEADLKQLVTEMAMSEVTEEISDKEINDYIRIIKAQHLDIANIQSLKQEQKLAEQQNDPVKAAQIAMQIINIKKQLKQTN
ncbi:DNA primase [Oceanobacillus piezotolerans]|uniref:DNA primase n=1 Tax=Oceanobacillus piezotolerans TaxID=2448030 RepID=A0A498DDE2_9BACI|nr:DNA primase [Oceanobacillus piezotolerans]RLL48056.1 DNA primase [Oceanobacillus piezotolerans]